MRVILLFLALIIDEEAVVVALLHDVGESAFFANHGEVAAAMLRPFVSPESYFVLKYHDLFQGTHYASAFGLDPHARDKASFPEVVTNNQQQAGFRGGAAAAAAAVLAGNNESGSGSNDDDERSGSGGFVEACRRFTDDFDSRSFDPDYDSLPLAFFEPMVHRLFERAPYDRDPTNPKRVVAWDGL